VFTVRDSVRYEPNKNSCFWQIDNFYIREDGVLLVRSKDNLMVETLSTIKHMDKLPLFTTEDGVEICQGEKFYIVDEKYGKFKMHETIGGHFTKEHKERKRFASKENAEFYVLRNSPCLSVNDILFHERLICIKGVIEDSLVELAKSKIKNQ